MSSDHLKNGEFIWDGATDSIIQSIKNDNLELLALIVNNYRQQLILVAENILGSACDAEEIVQDALLRACRCLPDFRGDSTLKTWLFRIVINLCKNRLRCKDKFCLFHLSGTDALQEELEFLGVKSPYWLEPDAGMNYQDLLREINQALSQLPENIQLTMQFRYSTDLSYKQIARIMNCSVGTVKSRIARGRDKLADCLRKSELETVFVDRRTANGGDIEKNNCGTLF